MLKSAVIEEKKFKHSPWAGADNSLRPNVLCQQEGLITMVICCKFKKNLFNLTLYTSFHNLTNVYSCRSGADDPRGHILMSTETSCRFGHLLQVSKSLSEVWFYTTFFMILYIYIAPRRGLTTPWGSNFYVNRNVLSLHSFAASLKKSLWSLILYNVFHDFIHVYNLGQGQTAPRGQSLDVNRNVLSLHSFVSSFKKMSLKSDFTHFFLDLIHIYSPGAEADSPEGTKVWCQQKCLVTSFIYCKFKKNLFEVWFYTMFFFSWFYTCVKSQGLTTPWGRNFYVNRNILSFWSFVASFKRISLKSDFIQFFFMILCMHIAPGQGQTAPRGQNFHVNRKALSHYLYVASFKEISLKSDFIQFFFHDLLHVYIPGTGVIQPLGDTVLMPTGISCPFGHLFLVLNHRWQYFLKNLLFYLFPIQKHKGPNLTCCKIGQGQPRVIIWTNLVVLEHPMLHTKFQGHLPFDKVFTIYGHGGHLGHVTRTFWSNFRSPIPWRLHRKFGFNWPSGFWGEDV